jgi:hypothetical protein
VGEDEEPFKLYIKVSCSLCLGGMRQGIFANCPYCNHERKTYIESPLKEIAGYINSLDPLSRTKLLSLLDDVPQKC